MTFSVQIVFQPQVIINIINFGDFSQVTIFESWVKNEDILLLRNVNFKLRVRKVSLGRKSWQVFEQVTVLVRAEIPFTGFFWKNFPISLFNLLFCKKNVRVDFWISSFFKIFDNFFTAGEFGVGIIYYYTVHFFSGLGLEWGFLSTVLLLAIVFDLLLGVNPYMLSRATSDNINALIGRAEVAHI